MFNHQRNEVLIYLSYRHGKGKQMHYKVTVNQFLKRILFSPPKTEHIPKYIFLNIYC